MALRSSSPQIGTKSWPSAPRPCSTISVVRGLGPVSISWASSMLGFPVRGEQLETALAVVVDVQSPPAGAAVEGVGARIGLGAEAQARQSGRGQPVDHDVVQRPPMALAVAGGVDEHRPDVAVARVANGEAGNTPWC